MASWILVCQRRRICYTFHLNCDSSCPSFCYGGSNPESHAWTPALPHPSLWSAFQVKCYSLHLSLWSTVLARARLQSVVWRFPSSPTWDACPRRMQIHNPTRYLEIGYNLKWIRQGQCNLLSFSSQGSQATALNWPTSLLLEKLETEELKIF